MSRPGLSGYLMNAVVLDPGWNVSLATLYYLRGYKALLMVPVLNYLSILFVCAIRTRLLDKTLYL